MFQKNLNIFNTTFRQEDRAMARRPEALSVPRSGGGTPRNLLVPPPHHVAPRTPQDVPPVTLTRLVETPRVLKCECCSNKSVFHSGRGSAASCARRKTTKRARWRVAAVRGPPTRAAALAPRAACTSLRGLCSRSRVQHSSPTTSPGYDFT